MNKIVFHTDVTKVLSADSYLHSRFSPGVCTPPPADPRASSDFIDLVEVITNDTFLQYRPAENQTGALNEACKDISVATEGHRPPVSPPVRDIDGVTQDAQEVLSCFAQLTQEEKDVRELAKWTRFQVSTSYLQDVFWAANNIEELQAALHVYKQSYSSDAPLIESALYLLSDHPYGYAGHRVANSSMSPSDFFIAYTFWAYIKGCRFARNLNENDIYMVHWLRERAICETDGARKGNLQSIGAAVPWGSIVMHQLESLSTDTSIQPLAESLRKLRTYTLDELQHASDRKKREDFLASGLVKFNETMGLNHNFGVDTLVTMAGEVVASKVPGVRSVAQFMLQKVNRPIRKARAKKTIRYLAKTDSRVAVFIEKGVED